MVWYGMVWYGTLSYGWAQLAVLCGMLAELKDNGAILGNNPR